LVVKAAENRCDVMAFTEYDQVVQALPADRANEPLNISVLPSIPNEVPRRVVMGKVIWRATPQSDWPSRQTTPKFVIHAV
jgi:predicted metal-dependent phosphoesterase TrpH